MSGETKETLTAEDAPARPEKRELHAFHNALKPEVPSPAVQDILVVDDQIENILALEAILDGMGHNVIRATSGREALRQILNRDIALVLLDVRMPNMDGFETARLIRDREKSRTIPIIFLTAASSSEEMMFEGYSAGGVDYIIKPFVPEVLRAKVEVFLNLAAARQKLEEEVRRRREAERELEKSAAKLRQRAEELEVVNRELEAFAYSASHDRDYLERIDRSVRKMGRLLDDLLHFSKMSRAEMKTGTVDLTGILEEAIVLLEPETRSRKITWRRASLPSVVGDAALLLQVFVNLLSNSIKYTLRRKRAEIEIGHYPERNEAVIFVRDNGAGFSMERYDKLSRLFQRLHNETDFPGNGMASPTCNESCNATVGGSGRKAPSIAARPSTSPSSWRREISRTRVGPKTLAPAQDR
jgi:two-component system, sensor histidine kinase and response regulator